MHYGKESIPTKVFLFDIGRVLLDFDFESSLVKLLPERIPNPQDRIHQILAQKDVLERGLMRAEFFANWALEIMQSRASVKQFYQAWRQIFTINEPMWRCVHRLADNQFSLILISNINAIHCPWIFEAYPEFSLFRYRVLSFETGMLKPECEIYQYAIDTFRLNPADTAYIDDQPANIQAGLSMGFQCWEYDLRQHHAFERWLGEITR